MSREIKFGILMELLKNGAGKKEPVEVLTEEERAARAYNQLTNSEGGIIARFIRDHLYSERKRTHLQAVVHDSIDKGDGKNRWWA
mgnify:CR=1 FL=1